MRFDMAALSDTQRYKLMAGCIVPRPIAWVSSLSADGIGNVAPACRRTCRAMADRDVR